MDLNDFINKLKEIRPELRKKQIFVVSPNGLLCEPKIKFKKKNISDLSLESNNVDYALITEY